MGLSLPEIETKAVSFLVELKTRPLGYKFNFWLWPFSVYISILNFGDQLITTKIPASILFFEIQSFNTVQKENQNFK